LRARAASPRASGLRASRADRALGLRPRRGQAARRRGRLRPSPREAARPGRARAAPRAGRRARPSGRVSRCNSAVAMRGRGMAAAAGDPWSGCTPTDPAFRDDPSPALHRLRAHDPVNETPVGIWRLTRYADVNRLLHDVPAGVRTTDGALPGVDETLSGQRNFMLQQDPPTHTRLRRLVSGAFTPRAIAALRAQIERIVDECLARVAARGDGRMDVIADLALPVPSTVICEMMGVPVADRERFTVWTSQATFGLAAPIMPPEVVQ